MGKTEPVSSCCGSEIKWWQSGGWGNAVWPDVSYGRCLACGDSVDSQGVNGDKPSSVPMSLERRRYLDSFRTR